MAHHVRVSGLPAFVDAARLLGPGTWTLTDRGDGTRVAESALDRRDAADLAARLRGVGLGGHALALEVSPALPRPWVRAARTEDARRRRDTTPGFTRPGVRLDPEGRMSLTPEALARDLGERAAGRRVIDAFCGAGGNTIGFARAGCAVTAIERDRDRLADARHNARLYGVADRVTFVHGDALEIVPGLDADLLFADPPWGEHWNRERTTAGDVPLLGPILAAADALPALWLKLPPSFAADTLPDFRAEAWFGRAPGDERRVKFLLLTWP